MTREKRWRLRDYLTLLTCAAAGLPIVGRLDQPGDVARQAHLEPAAPIDAAPFTARGERQHPRGAIFHSKARRMTSAWFVQAKDGDNMAISELDSNTPPPPAAGARPGFAALRLLRRRPLLAFYLLAYGITWLAWLPLVLSREGIGVLSIHLSIYYSLLGLALGPLLSTLVMTAATGGRAGLRALLDRCLLWRVGWQWYLRALIGVPIVLLLGPIMLPGAAAAFHLPPLGSILSYPITLVFAFLGAPLFEEPAWRGFALPRQQERFGPLLGALINGFFWGLWHLPLFLLPMWGRLGGGDTSLGGMMTFVLDATLFSVLIAWVVNSTRGSVFLAMVMAASSDAFIPYVRQLFPVPMVARSNVAGLIGYGIAAILLAVTTGARLDYQGESEALSRRAAQRATALSARK